MRFLPRCNGVLSQGSTGGKRALQRNQPAVIGQHFRSAESGQQFQFQYADQPFKRYSCCAILHWSLIPPGSSLKNYGPSQVLDNRRKFIGIYNLTEISFGLCHVTQLCPFPCGILTVRPIRRGHCRLCGLCQRDTSSGLISPQVQLRGRFTFKANSIKPNIRQSRSYIK